MIVTCVYKSGGDFTIEHVIALKAGLKKYLPCLFEFWVFTDHPWEVIGIADTTIELEYDLPGWWSKIELFRQEYPNNKKVIYFDLDVLPMKEMGEFLTVATSPGPTMVRGASRLGLTNNWPSSSIMSWKGNELSDIFTEFMRLGNVIEKSKNNPSHSGQQGDQGFIRTIINPKKFQDFLPDNYILGKREYFRDQRQFNEAHILNWTGKPRFQNMKKAGMSHIQKMWEDSQEPVKHTVR